MQRLWHRLSRVPSRTQCIYCNTLTTNSLRPKLTTPIFPLELLRFYDANSLFNPSAHSRRSVLEQENNKISPRNKSMLMSDFYRSLSTQDIDRIWPLYTYFYNNHLLHHLTRKNYHNLFTYTIRARASHKNLHRLTALVDDMKQRGFSLKLSEYNALIDWVGGKTVPHKHPHHLAEALKLFEEMQLPYMLNPEGEKVPKEPIQPTVPTFNILIRIATGLSDLRTAQKLYHDMISRGLAPDKFTYCTLLHAMGRLGDVDGIDMMLKELKQHGMMKNTIIWNVVMSGYAANGLKERTYAMFGQMLNVNIQNRKKVKKKKKDFSRYIPRADAESFKIYIDLLLNDGKRNEAISTLDRMQSLGVRPIVPIYNALFGTFKKKKEAFDYLFEIDSLEDPAIKEDLETIQKLYQQMKDLQVKPNSETMYTLVSAFLDLGDTNSALEAFVSLSKTVDASSKTDKSSIHSSSVSQLTERRKLIALEKSEPLKIEPNPELLERLNSLVARKSV